MIRNEDIPSEVFICGVKAERYRTSSGDGFRVKKFPFIFDICPQYTDPSKVLAPKSPCLNLIISIIGGREIWNEPQLIDNTDMVQTYQRAIERIEIAAANFIEDLFYVHNAYKQPGPRVIPQHKK